MKRFPRQNKNKIYRIIDANINRLTEGIRVCEDITRFLIDDYNLWIKFKKIRHKIFSVVKRATRHYNLIEARETINDIGKKTIGPESKRKDYQQIFFANIQRAKESLRVLEEFSKILQKGEAQKFKKIRYQIYTLEKEAARKLQALLYT